MWKLLRVFRTAVVRGVAVGLLLGCVILAAPVYATSSATPTFSDGPQAKVSHLEKSDPVDDFTATLIVGSLETILPTFVSVFEDYLSRYMKAVSEQELVRVYTHREFEKVVAKRVQELSRGQLTDLATEIHPDGFAGSAVIHVGEIKAQVTARIEIKVVNDQPHVMIHELTMDGKSVPEKYLKELEKNANRIIDRQRFPLKVKKVWQYEGCVLVAVELQ